MPLLFFIDKDILDDPACRNVDDVVLSYTFFRFVSYWSFIANGDPNLSPQGTKECSRGPRARRPRRCCTEFFGLQRLRAGVEEGLRLGRFIHLRHKVTYRCT